MKLVGHTGACQRISTWADDEFARHLSDVAASLLGMYCDILHL